MFTNKELLELYKAVLEAYLESYNKHTKYGLCFALYEHTLILFPEKRNALYILGYDFLKEPEFKPFMNKKPKECFNSDYWFPKGEKSSRIEILKQLVEETAK